MAWKWNNELRNDQIYCFMDPLTESNSYFICQDNQCVLIDPGSFEAAEHMLHECNMERRPLLVLLTHEHCDHIGGLNQLREKYHALVITNRACSLGIQNVKDNMSRMMEMYLYYKSGETKMVPYAPFVCKAADITFSDEICIPYGKSYIQIQSRPGHTHGSSIILYDGIIFSGDYLLPGQNVVTRLPGGCEAEYETYVKPWLQRIPNGTWIFPGHGAPFQMNEEVRVFHGL